MAEKRLSLTTGVRQKTLRALLLNALLARLFLNFPPNPLAVSWLPQPAPLQQPVLQQQLREPEPEAPHPLFKQPTKSPKEQSTEDTFRLRLEQTSSGTLDDFRKALLEQLSEKDPATGKPYTHDLWLGFQSCWARVHYEQRTTLFAHEDPHFEEQLGNGRMTFGAKQAPL